MFSNCYGIRLLVSFLTIFTASVSIQQKTYASVKESCAKIGSEKWLEEKLRQYPELLWLADSCHSLVPLQHASGNIKNEGYFSLELFDKQSPKFDQAVRSLIYLHLLLDGSKNAYRALNSLQNSEVLPFKQFVSAHKYFKRLLFSLSAQEGFEQSMRFFETSIILKNMGNSLKAQQIFQPYFSEKNEQLFYKKALQVLNNFPELSPSYRRLSLKLKNNLIYIGHIADYSGMFNLTKTIPSWEQIRALDNAELVALDLGIYFLDTCGKLGCNSSFFRDFLSFTQANLLLRDHNSKTAYYYYLSAKARAFGLSPVKKTDEMLTRIAVMMNIEPNPIEGAYLKEGFGELADNEIESIASYFFNGNHPETCEMKGLDNLINQLPLKLVSEQTRKEVIAAALRIFAKTLLVYDEMIAKNLLSPETELNFEEAIGFCNEIDLDHKEFSIRIHINGLVNLIT